MEEKRTFKFSRTETEGRRDMQSVLGSKGSGLAGMSLLGLNVPAGFTISTKQCRYYKEKGEIDEQTEKEVKANMEWLEVKTNQKWGESLLVSIRSGAELSMPGMMDTLLNVGITHQWIQQTSIKYGKQFTLDCQKRFMAGYMQLVLAIDKQQIQEIDEQCQQNSELTIQKYQKLLEQNGKKIPDSIDEQLKEGIKCVFDSWNNPRAQTYRQSYNIDHLIGTAVNIQQMVYGNLNSKSGSGVMFSRDINTGENRLFGEILMQSQGEDVVSGQFTPQDIHQLKVTSPNNYQELESIKSQLEKEFKDVVDIEFTIMDNEVYILQCRKAKSGVSTRLKMGLDLLEEGIINESELVQRIEPSELESLQYSQLEDNQCQAIGKGLKAGGGAISGKVGFDLEQIRNMQPDGILVRWQTNADDIEAMQLSKGIVTARGGSTSHAAVISRAFGKVGVVGVEDIQTIDQQQMVINQQVIKTGDWITVDGNNGYIYKGRLRVIKQNEDYNVKKLIDIANNVKKIEVRVNCDSADEIVREVEGVGLCRTEHMFFGKERINKLRQLIIKEDDKIIAEIKQFQKKDFKQLFYKMANKVVTIRLLDPPLHEFMPNDSKQIDELSEQLNMLPQQVAHKIEEMKESNPMLGHRGCRLGITHPQITELQVRAIMESLIDLQIDQQFSITVEIMVPLVSYISELNNQIHLIRTIQKEYSLSSMITIKYGTMIETPRACLIAEQIAEIVDFVSFGSNDLTQLTFGLSRDDSYSILDYYQQQKLIESDPFQQIDEQVANLMQIAISKIRSIHHKSIEIGVCGEHAADPSSIQKFKQIGVDYISCSMFRIPVAILAAAQKYLQ